MKHFALTIILSLCFVLTASAQGFFNLTADEVRIDSLLPCFTHQMDVGTSYADSIYEVSIDYPEFIDMSASDVTLYQRITTDTLPSLPVVDQYIAVERKRGKLCLSFVPLVFRDGKYQKLVSFKLSVKARPAIMAVRAMRRVAVTPTNRYATHSVLNNGKWAKISIPETGFYQLTNDLIQQAGFSNISKVKIYGYGGALQPEKLTEDYLSSTDDLKEVPTCNFGGHRVFFGVGPVNWATASTQQRTRNNYSTAGYYFLTESDGDPLTVDEQTFRSTYYPHPNDYHSMYEPEEFAWYHGGRNLYAKSPLSTGDRSYTFTSPSTQGKLSVAMSYDGYCEAAVLLNGTQIGTLTVDESTVKKGVSYFGNETTYSTMAAYTWSFDLSSLIVGNNTVVLRQTKGTNINMRLDHITLTFDTPKSLPDLSSAAVPSYVGAIANQDHHADEAANLIIIIPASRKLQAQAERLKLLHEQQDGMSVRIVAADELYNEFSSGTPDANAYRRYLKMLYDRAEDEAAMPRHLLLLGDCAYDNRMVSGEWSTTKPEDFLLCYESENSFSHVYCFVAEDYFGLLDDGEELEDSSRPSTDSYRYCGMPDVGIGRIPARTENEAKIVVDKTISYRKNEYAGAWQNLLCFMGDDGDNNLHMRFAETLVDTVKKHYTGFNIRKVYWDTFTRVTTSTGKSYPEVTRLLKQQMRDGALMMNYTGHGSATIMSHEQVLSRSDFAENQTKRLPLWITASCDIMPFDTQVENFGETALFNKNGGAIAFFGTTRTVFTDRNLNINLAFTRNVLSTDAAGNRITLGDAVRLTKNEMVTSARGDKTINKMNYALLGDPALPLAIPTLKAHIDSINNCAVSDGVQQLSAGSRVTVSGYIEGQSDFNGVVTITVNDVEQTIVCRQNDSETAMTFVSRPDPIYNGSDSIRNGRFNFTFAVPRDISYSSNSGEFLIYAIDNEKTRIAHGQQEGFTLNGTGYTESDGTGPSIFCYLNNRSFSNGDVVNATPYFYAEISDKDGINAAGSGIGHDMELIVDGDLSRTYSLNNYFQYDFGDYRSGTLGFSLPELTAGQHKLLLRVWDVLNNSSTAELSFVVDPEQEPTLLNVVCTRNPATTITKFLITHNRAGSQMDVTLQIMDTSGRLLWQRSESGVNTDETYSVEWDLTTSSGSRLRPGLYLYRVLVSSNGSSEASLAQKLIVK